VGSSIKVGYAVLCILNLKTLTVYIPAYVIVTIGLPIDEELRSLVIRLLSPTYKTEVERTLKYV